MCRKYNPPNAAQIVDISTEKLQQILAIPICKGPEIQEEANQFIGFSLAVQSIQEVEDAYLKMRLCYPKARHIICAFNISGRNFYQNKGYCDDGEHGAGLKLFNILEQNAIEQRVIFVTRVYGGSKIGPKRFSCITSVAEKCIELYPHNEILNESQYVEHDEEIENPHQPERHKHDQEWGEIDNQPTAPPTEYSVKRRRESSSPEQYVGSSPYKKSTGEAYSNDYPPLNQHKYPFRRGAYSNPRGRRYGGKNKY